MKNLLRAGILFLAFFTFINQTFAMEAMSSNKIIQLSPKEAQTYMKETKNLFILDVRTQAEYEEKNIKGSKLIPIEELSARLDEIPKNQAMVIYCRSGNRANQAAKIIAPTLLDAGIIFVVNGAAIYPAN